MTDNDIEGKGYFFFKINLFFLVYVEIPGKNKQR